MFGIHVTSENAGRFVVMRVLEHFKLGNIFVVNASVVSRLYLISIWEHGVFRAVCFSDISPGDSSAGRYVIYGSCCSEGGYAPLYDGRAFASLMG